MKKYYIDFEITAYLFAQERLRKQKSIYFDKDDLITFIDTFCNYLNNKDYIVYTKVGKKIEKYDDYVAVAKKICDTYTETECAMDTISGKKGLDALVFQYYFDKETFEKLGTAFKTISPEYLNLFADFEAEKVRQDYLHEGRYNFEHEMYKIRFNTVRQKEKLEQEEEEEENVALA